MDSNKKSYLHNNKVLVKCFKPLKIFSLTDICSKEIDLRIMVLRDLTLLFKTAFLGLVDITYKYYVVNYNIEFLH